MPEDIKTIIQNNPFLSYCDDQTLNAIVTNAKKQRFDKGHTLFVNGEQANYCYIATSGWIKLFRENIDGQQSITDIVSTNHLFGTHALFSQGRYFYSAETIEKTTIISIPLHYIDQALQNNPRFSRAIMEKMALRQRQQDQELENRTVKNAPQRISCFLMRFLDTSATGETTIDLPFDKTLIAARLGMQPETFSRALKKLKTDLDITIKGRSITLQNPKDLMHYACTACSSELPCTDLHTHNKISI